MTEIHISFDRGTLRLDGPVEPTLSALARFDDRTGHFRAAAYRYDDIRRACGEFGVTLEDRVGPAAFDPPPRAPIPSLRPYQEQAIAALERFGRRGVVALPTGSGKTRVACAALARAGRSSLILVPTRALLDQWASVLRAGFGEPVGLFGDGSRTVEPITVMTFESAYRCLDRYGHRWSALVVDEAHHFSGGARAEALEMCCAPIRIGLTATPPPPGSPGEGRLRDLIGPVVFELTIAELAGRDLAELDVVRLPVALTADERIAYERDASPFLSLRRDLLRATPGADWVTCLRAIAFMPGGGEVIAAFHRASALASFPSAKRAAVRSLLARHRAEPTLLFTATTEDAYAIGADALIPVITADVPRGEREAILAAFRARAVRAIASARVLNEGVDVPEASVAVITGGALGQREHIQRIGRILRPREGKRAVAYELVTLDTIDEARSRARRSRLVAHRPALDDPR